MARRAKNKEPEIDRIECRYHGSIQITPNEIELHLQQTMHQQASFYQNSKSLYSIPFFIPNISVATVTVSVSTYAVKNDFSYDIALWFPCSLEDMQMLKIINNYIKRKCSEADYHKQGGFNRCINYPGEEALADKNLAATWQQLMKSFYKAYCKKEAYQFRVSNGRLVFWFSNTGLQLQWDFNQICNKFLPLMQAHLWQQMYATVDSTRYYLSPVKQNGWDTKRSIDLVIWHNNVPVAFGYQSYLAIQYGNEWKAIRYKNWEKLLTPFLHQYDDEHKNLIPVLPGSVYETVKAALLPLACSIRLTASIVEGRICFFGMVE